MLKDINFINIAEELATGSKCISTHVWAIIVKEWRILSTWYNWTPAWYQNCNQKWDWPHPDHHEWSMKHEIHAEMNAILWAARNWVSIKDATIYCTYQPCFDCTKNIIASWIKKIVFKNRFKHNNGDEVEKFVTDNNCEVIQVSE